MNDDTVGAATGEGLIRFLDYVGEKGLVNQGTAKAYRITSREILSTVEGEETWESVDLRGLDVDDLLARFATKAGMRYTPKSLQTYRSRFRKALGLYIEYLQDPGGWRPAKPQPRPGASGRGRRATVAAATEPVRAGNAIWAPSTSADLEAGAHSYAQRLDMHNYTYPIRREGRTVFATLQLPVDLSMKEAERIGAYLRTLAVEEQPAISPRPPHPDAG